MTESKKPKKSDVSAAELDGAKKQAAKAAPTPPPVPAPAPAPTPSPSPKPSPGPAATPAVAPAAAPASANGSVTAKEAAPAEAEPAESEDGSAAAAPPPWMRVSWSAQQAAAAPSKSGAVASTGKPTAAAPGQATVGLADAAEATQPVSSNIPTEAIPTQPGPTTPPGGAPPPDQRAGLPTASVPPVQDSPLPGAGWSAARPARTRQPRQAHLQLRRIDPWSVLKLSLVLSVVAFFVWMVAVGVLYGVLAGMGVWDQINVQYNELAPGAQPGGGSVISVWRVLGFAAIVGAVNCLLFAVAATIGAFVYNVSSDLVGGIEVTLSERD